MAITSRYAFQATQDTASLIALADNVSVRHCKLEACVTFRRSAPDAIRLRSSGATGSCYAIGPELNWKFHSCSGGRPVAP